MKILKKAIAIGAIMLIIFASSVTIAVTKTKGKVVTETLRLRKEASLESTVLDLLSKDDEVEIIAEEGDWYKVNFKTYTGYVSKEYISKNDDSEGSTNSKQEDNKNEDNKSEDNKDEKNNDENKNQTPTNENNEKNKSLVNKQAMTNSDLNVYILPLINSNIIGSLKQDTKVDIVNITGLWAYIKTENITGWIRVDKISVTDSNDTQNNNTNNQNKDNPEQTTNQNNPENQTNNQKDNNETTTTSNEKEYTPKNYYIKSSAVNIRSKSTTSSDVVTTLTQNTQVKVVGEEGDWYKVEVNGKSGYILKSLLSASKVEVTSRSSNQDRSSNNTETKKQTSTNNTEQQATTYNSSKGEEIIVYAKKYLGCKYVYGGSGPSTFDCSGFTMYVYKHFGYSMGHSAVTQAGLGKYVSKSNLQPGDLVIFNNSANTSIGHVGIYVGGGNFIHASSGGGRIMISSLSGSYYKARYVTARRII